MKLDVRTERLGDELAVHALNVVAFPTDAEARLVDALRAEIMRPEHSYWPAHPAVARKTPPTPARGSSPS